ncbi:type IV toxin-antitoxin system AbiEi family antitoxin domain-containing protein [Gordonia zhaorongruii]|uniref:type IV toxin-antitoxin system AbiEi family antitoxin domain-containing protein n=1 Tax=Gordonia zhaorongruii TaxID=2597659 RepID=UPI00117C85CC|nr:type IV toxin-antitoxin system AbiEi family antitoxin domain-containing protein [Gordonia zhaorongruii]
MQLPFDEHGILYRQRAVAVGVSATHLARACDGGELERIAPGAYVASEPRSATALHLLRARTAAAKDPSLVFSHATAAVIHGLPMLKPELARVEVISDRRPRRRTLRVHTGRIDITEVTTVGGLCVPSVEATAVAVACTSHLGFAGALAVFDGALAQGASSSAITELLKPPRHGVATARCAFAHADALSANPGESWGRAQILEAGLPRPRLQHEFHDGRGRFVAQTDYDWDGRVVGEFDGYGKYEDYNCAGATPIDVVRREKKRQNRLESMQVTVIRWDWSDLENRRVVPRLRPRLVAAGLL